MATPARDLTPFQLPKRIRSKTAAADAFSARLALAERIAQLPAIVTIDASNGSGATLPWSVDVFLQPSPATLRGRQPAVLLYNLSRDSVAVYGLSDSDRHQVLSRGWGKLGRNCVLLYMPRDSSELDVCWDILQRAHKHLVQSSAVSSAMRESVWQGMLPRFSRTTLQ